MDAHALRYWIAFNRVNGIGAARFHGLLAYFNGDLEAAWRASETDLANAIADGRAVASVVKARRTADLDADLAMVNQVGARAITLIDAEYPALLRAIDNPPPLLYVKGALYDTDRRAVAFVGTRDASEYGLKVTQELVRDLCAAGLTIVSGLAKGIDGMAHRSAIGVGGRTFALLGHGIERVYPADHSALAGQIPGHGALITEFPIGTPPDGNNFPMRNRLISGLSVGVVVVEAKVGSGALSTAEHAFNQNREVFAVPGSIYSAESRGTHRLIQDNQAKLIGGADDIFDELRLIVPGLPDANPHATPPPAKTSRPPRLPTVSNAPSDILPPPDAPPLALPELSEAEAFLLNGLGAAPLSIDELCVSTGWPTAAVIATLVRLELHGLAVQTGVRSYVRGG